MNTENIYNNQELLQQISEGDEKAFRIIYDQYRGKIYTYAFHFTESTILADEVIQETFLKVWLKRKSLQEVENFSAWIYAIAKNYMYDALKAAAREMQLKRSLESNKFNERSDTEDALSDKLNTQLLQEALDQLSPQQRQVYILSREQGLKRQQIAEQMNISENTVKTHMSQALKHITAFIQKRAVSTLLWTMVLEKHILS
ncbi:MAG: RNA polymerase sigma factor [Chitinophagaceae bacterium]|nr:RNA polymerase sigma factor [Chitinophagaceae bacterium]